MTLATDVYRNFDATVEEVGEARGRDDGAQEGHWITDRNYWVDEDHGAAFCPFEGSSRDAGVRVHLEAHG